MGVQECFVLKGNGSTGAAALILAASPAMSSWLITGVIFWSS